MMSLFSGFDMFFFGYQKFSFALIILLLVSKNFYFNSTHKYIVSIFSYLNNFFLSIKNSSLKLMYIILYSIFLSLFFINFSSVLSYNFAFCSQISVVLITSLTFWLSFIMVSSVNNLKGFLSHLVPMGTPMYLVWFLFLIEIVSNLIRFITLTVRLVANILAGHLLMILLSKMVLSSNLFGIFYLGLNIVEIFVSLIQSYIFSTMLVLYFSEID